MKGGGARNERKKGERRRRERKKDKKGKLEKCGGLRWGGG